MTDARRESEKNMGRERSPGWAMSYLLRFFDYFLPDSLCTNPSDLMRGYIIVGLIFANIAICLLIMLGLVYLLELEYNTPIALALNGVCLLGYCVTLVLLKRTENYILCSNLIIAILGSVIVCGVQITGGYLESPILQLLPLSQTWFSLSCVSMSLMSASAELFVLWYS